MTERPNRLSAKLRKVFSDSKYPEHLTLRAAEKMDDWIDDPQELASLSKTLDEQMDWWSLDTSLLKSHTLALSYLDCIGVRFYLPAYLTMLLNRDGLKCARDVSHLVLPPTNSGPLSTYFTERFALFNTDQKQVCIKVFSELAAVLHAEDPNASNEFAEAAASGFWIAD